MNSPLALDYTPAMGGILLLTAVGHVVFCCRGSRSTRQVNARSADSRRGSERAGQSGIHINLFRVTVPYHDLRPPPGQEAQSAEWITFMEHGVQEKSVNIMIHPHRRRSRTPEISLQETQGSPYWGSRRKMRRVKCPGTMVRFGRNEVDKGIRTIRAWETHGASQPSNLMADRGSLWCRVTF